MWSGSTCCEFHPGYFPGSAVSLSSRLRPGRLSSRQTLLSHGSTGLSPGSPCCPMGLPGCPQAHPIVPWVYWVVPRLTLLSHGSTRLSPGSPWHSTGTAFQLHTLLNFALPKRDSTLSAQLGTGTSLQRVLSVTFHRLHTRKHNVAQIARRERTRKATTSSANLPRHTQCDSPPKPAIGCLYDWSGFMLGKRFHK